MKCYLLVILFVLAFSSCSNENAKQNFGYVVGKEHVPSLSYIEYDVVLKIPAFRFIPDRYIIWVADPCKVYSYDVSEIEYNSLKYGDYTILK